LISKRSDHGVVVRIDFAKGNDIFWVETHRDEVCKQIDSLQEHMLNRDQRRV